MSRIRRCPSVTAARALVRSRWSPGINPRPLFFGVSVLYFALLLVFSPESRGEETNTSPPLPGRLGETNTQETLRAYLQLQEQLHLTQLAIEQNRKEAKEAAVQSAGVLAERLEAIERALSSQRARELDAMQSSNRVMLTVAGTFAVIGFVAMLLMAYFQWRTVHGLAEVSAAMSGNRALGQGPAVAALGTGGAQLLAVGSAAQSNLRLLGSLEQLEKRIHELEHTPHAELKEGAGPGTNDNGQPAQGLDATILKISGGVAQGDEANRIRLLLGKGQSMLNLDKASQALACFEEALTLDPENAEALIKKGTALERLQKLDEAIDCYDRAIAVDSSMTIAYLHKGGLFNRMERFNEALECYEKALRTQEKRHG